MSLLDWIGDMFSPQRLAARPPEFWQVGHQDEPAVNPATGLPMVGGMAGLDAAGNPWGMGDQPGGLLGEPLAGDSGDPVMDGINPATGLPMVGGLDVEGNLYGTGSHFDEDINPATGLPMIGGLGGMDVAGNPFGISAASDDDWISSDLGSGLDDGGSSCGMGAGLDDDCSSCGVGGGLDDDWSSSGCGGGSDDWL